MTLSPCCSWFVLCGVSSVIETDISVSTCAVCVINTGFARNLEDFAHTYYIHETVTGQNSTYVNLVLT
jgi:hypothetical protein